LWYASGEYKVTKATFCIYNAFQKVDVRCEANFPGHVRTYYVDGAGKITDDVPDELWGQAFLCSLIRAQQPPPALPCIKILPPAPLHLDTTFLDLVKRFFWEGVFSVGIGTKPQIFDKWTGSKLGNGPEDGKEEGNHMLSSMIKDYFKITRRPEQGFALFNSITPRKPAIAVHEVNSISSVPERKTAGGVYSRCFSRLKCWS
jgi:hypothetical protein